MFDQLELLRDLVVAEETEVAQRAKGEPDRAKKQYGRRGRPQNSEF